MRFVSFEVKPGRRDYTCTRHNDFSPGSIELCEVADADFWVICGHTDAGKVVVFECEHATERDAQANAFLYAKRPFNIRMVDFNGCRVTTFDAKGDPAGHEVTSSMAEKDAELFARCLNALHTIHKSRILELFYEVSRELREEVAAVLGRANASR